jgi:membrane associated rhomboid family serine protease
MLTARRWRLWQVNQAIVDGQVYRLLTACVLHANLLHLAVNSYSLHAVGPAYESAVGRPCFIGTYVASGFVGNVLSFRMSPNPAVGASGAIFGAHCTRTSAYDDFPGALWPLTQGWMVSRHAAGITGGLAIHIYQHRAQLGHRGHVMFKCAIPRARFDSHLGRPYVVPLDP